MLTPDDERYMTGARVLRALQQAETIEIDGPGLAAHQVETIIDIPESEATHVCRLLVAEGLATEHATSKTKTPYWRFHTEEEED